MNTQNILLNIDEVVDLINKGKLLVLAGNEDLLKKLPCGNWIGGTIPYFMDINGGCLNKDRIFVTDFSEYVSHFKIKKYNTLTIDQIVKDRYANGFSFILIPCFSDILTQYALKTQYMPDLYDSALMGWVTGIDLADVGKLKPKIFDGKSFASSDKEAVVMHFELPPEKRAVVEIINIFTQGDGDVLMFEKDSFEVKECFINGKKQNLTDYIKQNKIDTRIPLVANYSGAMINVSFQHVDENKKSVLFYAPLLKGVEYRLAKPVEHYVSSFMKKIPTGAEVISSCNCILNYLYSELEGQKTGLMRGPFTFGEIAYVLVNQTLVYLKIF